MRFPYFRTLYLLFIICFHWVYIYWLGAIPIVGTMFVAPCSLAGMLLFWLFQGVKGLFGFDVMTLAAVRHLATTATSKAVIIHYAGFFFAFSLPFLLVGAASAFVGETIELVQNRRRRRSSD